MSVLKRKRRVAKTEVFHHLFKLKREMTSFLAKDFGYDINKANAQLLKTFNVSHYNELDDAERLRFHNKRENQDKFHNWLINEEKKVILDLLREINKKLTLAEHISILSAQDKENFLYYRQEALGLCYFLSQELQYIIEVLPVDVNKFLPFGELIQTEINLIKTWHKAKLKRVISNPSSANFANVNSNGNANNNNASNVNGVRPDFATGENASVKACYPSIPGSEGRGCPSLW